MTYFCFEIFFKSYVLFQHISIHLCIYFVFFIFSSSSNKKATTNKGGQSKKGSQSVQMRAAVASKG